MIKHFKYLTLLFFISFWFQNITAQEDNQVLILKNLSSGKEKLVAPNSKFKAKLTNKKKIKGRIAEVKDSFFISGKNDTINFSDIYWLKAKKQLSKMQRGAGIVGLFAGILYTPATFMGTTMLYIMHRSTPGNPAIFLVNAIPTGVLIISVRTLAGRRYKMKNWELQTQQAETYNSSSNF